MEINFTVDEIYEEKRRAIDEIRHERDLAIDAIHSEISSIRRPPYIDFEKSAEARFSRDLAEAVRRERERARRDRDGDAIYDSNERRHNEGRNKKLISSNEKITLDECKKNPSCDPIEELMKLIQPLSSEKSDIGDAAGRVVDGVTDLIREHNIGGQRGRDLADEVDRSTGREERERRDQDTDRDNKSITDSSYEDIKKLLYENIDSAKSVGIINDDMFSMFKDELNDWCGTPPKLPSPWNPNVFIERIAQSISERIDHDGIDTPPTEKIIGVGAAIAVVRVVGIIAILASGAHSMGEGK